MLATLYPELAKEFRFFFDQELTTGDPHLPSNLNQLNRHLCRRHDCGELSTAWYECLAEQVDGILENHFSSVL
jgi:hypothetical protein